MIGMSCRDVVISGCSGGGKSTLLAELASRGFQTVPEPGRRIVREQMGSGGTALPWVDAIAFAELAIDVAARDRKLAPSTDSWTFYDRGLVDAAVALAHVTGRPAVAILAPYEPYHRRVFLTPPWPEIYEVDAERPHGMYEAIAEYDRLMISFGELGYEPTVIPKAPAAERAAFVIDKLTQELQQ